MSSRVSRKQLAILSTLLFCVSTMPAHAATITVTNTNDSGLGSLRQALRTANDGDTINFAVTGTITLTTGGLPVNKSLTISGPGTDQLSIDGNQALLVFGIFPDKTAMISGLSIRNGQTGIWNERGTLTVSNCTVSRNSEVGLLNDGRGVLSVSNCNVSGNSGGGILNSYGVLTVIFCDVSGNSYGIDNDHGVEASVSNCIISSNHPYGGIFNNAGTGGPNEHILGADLTIANTIISDNSESGLFNQGGQVMILNSTLSGNSAGQENAGGGVNSPSTFKRPGSIAIINSTISGNSAGAGGGISVDWTGLTIVNSTISGNSAGNYGGGIASEFRYDDCQQHRERQLGCYLRRRLRRRSRNWKHNPERERVGKHRRHCHFARLQHQQRRWRWPFELVQAIRSTPTRCLVRCGITEDQRSRICRCGAALRLTRAIRILLRHLITTSAASVFTVCSVVALMSVQSRHNYNRGA